MEGGIETANMSKETAEKQRDSGDEQAGWGDSIAEEAEGRVMGSASIAEWSSHLCR